MGRHPPTAQWWSLLSLLLPLASSQTVLNLSDLAWTLSNPPLNISVLASFPSQAHLDLYDAQVIGNPYFGLNDFNLRWVGWQNWTYSAMISPLDRKADETWLLFQGLDTFTSIDLCGIHVAATNNQFRQYYFEVSQILKNCTVAEPTLSLNFGSAPNIVNEIAKQPGQETWPSGVELVYEFPNRQFMRKEQSDFGWDWGPAFAPAGPWLPAYVVQQNTSALYPRNVLVDIYRQEQLNNRIPDQTKPWVLNCSVDVLGTIPADASLSYALADADGHLVSHGSMQNVSRSNTTITGTVIIQNKLVGLWWPTGMGEQTLYNLTLQITPGNASSRLTSVQRTVGFRTIVLNEEVVSEAQLKLGIAPGNNWHFEINGHEFFAKGSNFIPPDAFWPRVTEQKIRKLFEAIVAANQNMLRVWSSGAYSPDFLYDIADEMGILLWCEFEFGDSLYPVDQVFLDNVYEEAAYQVRRVNHHPSMAFWAGGNELENLELLLVNSTSKKDYVRYKDEYEKLFLTTLFPAVFENTRSISYAPSSTSNGFISLNFTQAPYMQERYENLENGSIYGETDYYNYNSAVAFDFGQYPVGRFSNEFGFHSMPSVHTWKQAISPRDLFFDSKVIQHRNHHYPPGNLNVSDSTKGLTGLQEMIVAVERWFPTPAKTNSVANFSSWCHSTQLFQAAYYVNQIAFYRRGAGLPQRTLGSLYWQLEDIWQAPTWAGIEYDGRWKVLHYRGRDAYQNVIVYPFFNASDSVEVWVMSDLWQAANGTVDVTWYNWAGDALPIAGLQGQEFTVGAINATKVFSGNVTQLLAAKKLSLADVVVRVNVTASGYRPNNLTRQTFTHETWMAAVTLANSTLVDPGLKLSYDAASVSFVVEATKGVAAWVWLDYPGGAVVEFEDNGFWLGKREQRRVHYTVKMDETGGTWREGVTVASLWNSTLAE